MEPLSLLIGWPAPSLLPAAAISKAAQAVLADPKLFVPGLQYGPDEGYMPLRNALGKWLSDFYEQEDLTYERYAITGGASQNLACVLQVFTDPVWTRDILMVAPSYMMIYPAFLDNGFAGRLVAVPEDAEGLDLDVLRQRLVESDRKQAASVGSLEPYKPRRTYSKYYRHVIYCVPTFSNPSSRMMSHRRRVELVRLAREFDALIISDDVYDQLQWKADPNAPHTPLKKATLPRLVDIDRALDGGPERAGADGFGNTMSNGSFSKICGPGVRVGWAEGSAKFAYGVSQCGSTTSGGAPSQLTSTYIAKLLEDGTLQDHIFGTLQPAYASRYTTIMKAIKKHLIPLGVELPQPGRDVIGGYFVWLHLPDELSATEYARRCKEAHVPILAGPKFEIPGDERVRFPNHVRLCFSWIDEELIDEAVKRIAEVLRDMLKERLVLIAKLSATSSGDQ